jgi:hypothetical protein
MGLQAPALSRCLDLLIPIYNPPSVGPDRAGTHDKRITSLSSPHLLVYARDKEICDLTTIQMQRPVLNRYRQDKCNQSLARIAQPSPYQIPSIVPPGLQLLSIYNPCDSNMIIVTIIYFLSLVSDRQSLDFYRSPAV